MKVNIGYGIVIIKVVVPTINDILIEKGRRQIVIAVSGRSQTNSDIFSR